MAKKLRIPRTLPKHYHEVWREVIHNIEGVESSDVVQLTELCRIWYLKQSSTAHYNKAVIDGDFARAKHFQGVMENSHRDAVKMIQYFTDRARKDERSDGLSLESLMGTKE